jgi:adenylate cyclase
VLDHWATGPHPLGIGVGVASGRVTVGAIGSGGRMEYGAVGTAVNLASRLCSAAGAGEVLADAGTVLASGRSDLQPHEPVLAKGLTGEREVYVLSR